MEIIPGDGKPTLVKGETVYGDVFMLSLRDISHVATYNGYTVVTMSNGTYYRLPEECVDVVMDAWQRSRESNATVKELGVE